MNRALVRSVAYGVMSFAGAGILLVLAAAPAAAGPDKCISINGVVKVQKGTATCSSAEGSHNKAKATGESSQAVAGASEGDQHNRATASGDFSFASAGGNGNTATASGDGSSADAGGTGSTATASGDGRPRRAGGDGNTATASGDNSGADS